MPVAFDAKFLFFLFDPEPAGDDTAVAKVNSLLAQLGRLRETIIVPTPALAELLTGAGDRGPDILEKLEKSSAFQIEPFGIRAAIEIASWETQLQASGAGKRDGFTDEPYQKIKVDRQICAIAKVSGATTIYSEDKSLRTHAGRMGLTAFGIADLPEPPPEAPDLFAAVKPASG